MIVAVLDTNVIVSGLLNSTSTPPGMIFDRWLAGEFEVVLSEAILGEVETTLQKPYFPAAYYRGASQPKHPTRQGRG